MRDIVVYSLTSLDGVAEEPGNWMFEADEDVFENLAAVISEQDDVIMGRGTYDYWSDFWPGSEVQPFANFINQTTKHVFTSSRPATTWSNSVVVNAPLVDYVHRLKEGAGGTIGVHGSIALARDLMAADLVDRLELVIVPTVAGSGRRLLGDTSDLKRLELIKMRRSATGCVFLGYARP